MRMRVVIIGNSAAGLAALEAFRKRDRDSKILLIDQESVLAYSRMITPYFIMGKIEKEEGLFLTSGDFYEKLGIRTLFGKKVESIDIRSRSVVLNKGKKEPFDYLLIATGSSANRPKIEGAGPENILVLRNLSDARRLKEMKLKAKKVLFSGGGLVSLQTLQALYRPEGEYTLVVKSDRILSQVLDHEASEIVERQLSKMGVRIIKGRDVVRLKETKDSKVAVLDDGEEIETDFIFAGKGVKPNISFLQGGGIKTQNGILVDDYVETNVKGIYAAGDAAQAPDFFSDEKVNYGLWPSAVEQGEIAGKNMAGLKEVYCGNLRMNVTTIFSLPIASIGDFESKRVVETLIKKDERGNVYRKISLNEKGIIIGALLINEWGDFGIIHGLIRARRDAEILKCNSIWKSTMSYGFIYKDIFQGRV
jgi:nitrite reductase (NADH) large subunit